jgi:apolipoprotein N-acyltransferase
LLKISRIILAVIVALIAGYGLFTGNFKFQTYMMFFLGLMLLVMGIDEFQKGRKGYGLISIVAFLFILFVFVSII